MVSETRAHNAIPPFVVKATTIASLGGLLFGLDLGCISGALPQIVNAFDLTERQSELVVSFLYIGGGLGAAIGGSLCDAAGRKSAILVTDIVFLLGAVILFFSPSLAVVLLGRIVMGFGVAVSAIADVSLGIGPSEINRVSQERVAIISANLNYGALDEAAEEAQSIVNRIPRPQGIEIRVAGQNEEMQQSFTSMQYALALAIFLVYLVMASIFESLLHPFVILFSIPLAIVGAILALYVTGSTISVVVFIGLIMLAGIVVNNAIVLIDLINQLRAKGMARMAAIQEAGRSRLRPIIMTTLTTTFGMLPLALGFGEGAEIRAPMAITVIGGLLVSTLLTLIVVPVVYSLVDRKKFDAAEQG